MFNYFEVLERIYNAVLSAVSGTVTGAAKRTLSPQAIGAGGTLTVWQPATGAPTAAKSVQLMWYSISVDAATRVELRWGTAFWVGYYLPANGSVVANLIQANEKGPVGIPLVVFSSAACNITVTAKGAEV